MKLSCETSLKKWKLKIWKRSFRARLPSKSEGWRCENEAFMRDFREKVKVEDVKTKRSCKTSLKNWKLKMWKQSFRARLCSKRRRCENDAFVRDDLALRSSHSLLLSPWDHLTLISTRSHLNSFWDPLTLSSTKSKWRKCESDEIAGRGLFWRECAIERRAANSHHPSEPWQ